MKKPLTITLLIIVAIVPVMGKDGNNNMSVLQLTKEIKITEIDHNVFMITHSFPWPGNSLVLVLDKMNIVWIDTPYTPEATSLVLDWIRNRFGNNYSITEINTGFHIDNLGGNRELIKNDIPVYGSGLTCELIKTKSAATMSKIIELLNKPEYKKYKDTYMNFRFYCPTNTFDINEEQKIILGSEEIIVYYPGPTHTYDNVVVYIPCKNLLFGGCMILASDADNVGFIEDGNLHEWANSLLQLEKRFDRIGIVIPGHGNPGDSSLINHTKEIVVASARMTED
ncbi:MAG: MBL fold metallo-hydrolase [Spirochaetales bacterium]|nr:MBL fold metallo-hydrolase [Spirochaetales bacterium]